MRNMEKLAENNPAQESVLTRFLQVSILPVGMLFSPPRAGIF